MKTNNVFKYLSLERPEKRTRCETYNDTSANLRRHIKWVYIYLQMSILGKNFVSLFFFKWHLPIFIAKKCLDSLLEGDELLKLSLVDSPLSKIFLTRLITIEPRPF